MSIKNIGKHKVRHGDVNDKRGIAGLVGVTKANIFYSDPPWGNLKYWDTLNKKQNGVGAMPPATTNIDEFLDTVMGYAATFTDGWIVIEFGQQWTDQIIDIAKSYGLYYCGQVEALYNGNLPLDIMFFRTDKAVKIDLSSIYHQKGYTCVKKIFKLLKTNDGDIGMDLCCGMGYTAQACVDNGLTFIGNELNKSRLNKTIARLEKDKLK